MKKYRKCPWHEFGHAQVWLKDEMTVALCLTAGLPVTWHFGQYVCFPTGQEESIYTYIYIHTYIYIYIYIYILPSLLALTSSENFPVAEMGGLKSPSAVKYFMPIEAPASSWPKKPEQPSNVRVRNHGKSFGQIHVSRA